MIDAARCRTASGEVGVKPADTYKVSGGVAAAHPHDTGSARRRG
jgi:hypothetical protein